MRHSLLVYALVFLAGAPHLTAASEKASAPGHAQNRYQKFMNAPHASLRQVAEEWRAQMRSAQRQQVRSSAPPVAKTAGIAQTMQKFPHQFDDFFYSTSAPVALSNGNVLFFWSTDDTLFTTLSIDGAQTWGDRVVVGLASSFIYEVAAVQQANGTILTIMEVDEGIDWVSSTDNGGTWSSPSRIGGTTGVEFEPSLTEATDGTLFLAYYTGGPTSADVVLRSSTDGGTTWGTQSSISSDPANEFAPTIVSGNGSTLVALYMLWTGDGFAIMKRTSTDGGTGWSSPTAVVNGPESEYRPRAARAGDGTLHLVFITDQPSPTFPDLFRWELYSSTSADGGATWSTPARFTYYVGDDGVMNITLLNGQPLVTFQSTRWLETFFGQQLWYGIVGSTIDSDAPPVAYRFFGTTTTGSIKSNPPSYLTTGADDDTGISAVSVTLNIGGVGAGPFPMFDDGSHGDGAAGDGIWGADIPGLQPLDTVVYAVTVTDLDNNTVAGSLVFGYFALALPGHATGSLSLAVQPRGVLGALNPFTGFSEGFNAFYSGDDYLFTGGLWVGSRVGRFLQKRVASVPDPFEEGDWNRSPGTPIAIGPGGSDEDITMTYDDENSPLTLGLKVTETSYHWTADTRNDFVIFSYAITNTGAQGSLSEVYASFFLDADIPLGESFNDRAGYDATRGLLYMYDSQMDPSAYIGMLYLDGALPAVANAPTTSSLGSETQDYDAMTTNNPPGTPPPGDYAMLLTAPAFPLDSLATTTVAYGIVMGRDLQDLQANADTMKAIYTGSVVSVDADGFGELPDEYALEQNYPNPFNPSTMIRYQLPQTSAVRLEVYNALGQLMQVLVDSEQAGGIHSVRFDAAGLPSGVYFYRLSAGTFTATNKLMLMK